VTFIAQMLHIKMILGLLNDVVLTADIVQLQHLWDVKQE
jgi:hypothetical protein